MLKRSQRTATKVGDDLSLPIRSPTVSDFLNVLKKSRVDRATIDSYGSYCSLVLNSGGSQFMIYTDDGLRNSNNQLAVVKQAKFRLPRDGAKAVLSSRAQFQALLKEVLVLTNARLRGNPCIVELLSYDLIDVGDQNAIPVLVVEKAEHGSLDAFLSHERSLSELERVHLCADFVAGLTSLHDAEVIHGDVKPDNVLVFTSKTPDIRFRAKLSDFGSIVPFASVLSSNLAAPISRLYFGTPIYNAPEVEGLQSQPTTNVRSLIRCDAYSLGLSICQTLDGHLDEELTNKDKHVLPHAIQKAKTSGFQPQIVDTYCQILDRLLRNDPEQRCSNLKEIEATIQQFHVTYHKSQSVAPLPIWNSHAVGYSDEAITEGIQAKFGSAAYLDYGWEDELAIPQASQRDILNSLLTSTQSKDRHEAGHAYFEVAMAFAIGLGAPANVEKAMDALMSAARQGYMPAYAHFSTWGSINGHEDDIDEDTRLDWLYEAVTFGSFHAGDALRKMDSGEYALARREFHSAGGYTQYIEGQLMRQLANSPYHRDLVTSKSSVEEIGAFEEFAFSAAAYGDALLLTLLLERGLDPGLTNIHGESLLVVSCKAGNLNNLEVLTKAGASANMKNDRGEIIRASCLYWLTAFDSSDMERAAHILFSAGAGSAGVEYATCNFPSLDFPGYFPRACALHSAIWSNDCEAVRQLCILWPQHVNAVAPHEPITPLEFALRCWRLDPARILIEYGALADQESNKECLIDLGSMPPHEAWCAQGLYRAHTDNLPIDCIELVNRHAPHLLDQPGETGFTALMEAAQNHNTKVVRHLLSLGCQATRETPPESDGRTALNLLTENKLQYAPDDIIEVLLEGGADLSHQSCVGGKTLLHFAARDDIVWIAERCLDLGINVNSRAGCGETPLHTAALYGSVGVGRLLISRGADLDAVHQSGAVNAHDWRGLTPLAWTVPKLRREFMKMLLEQGSSLMARPSTKSTMLHLAVGEQDTQLLELLLDMPIFLTTAALDAKDTIHEATALHYCVGNFTREAHAKLLIEAGADVNAITGQGWTVLDIFHETRKWIGDKIERAFHSLRNFSEGRDDGDETMPSYEEYEEEETEIAQEVAEAEATRARWQDQEWQRGADAVGEATLDEFYKFGEHHQRVDIIASWRALLDIGQLLEASDARSSEADVQYGAITFK